MEEEEKDRKEVIRRCPYCHQDMLIKKGLSGENLKRLFRKPTFEDFIVLFIVLMTIVSFLVYTYEVKAYQAYINENCPIGQQNQQADTGIYLPPFSEIDNLTGEINSSNKELNNTTPSNNSNDGKQ